MPDDDADYKRPVSLAKKNICHSTYLDLKHLETGFLHGKPCVKLMAYSSPRLVCDIIYSLELLMVRLEMEQKTI